MTKSEKISRSINDAFSSKLSEAFLTEFSVEVETRLSLVTMILYTVRVDENEFPPEQHFYLKAFSNGYGQALGVSRSIK